MHVAYTGCSLPASMHTRKQDLLSGSWCRICLFRGRGLRRNPVTNFIAQGRAWGYKVFEPDNSFPSWKQPAPYTSDQSAFHPFLYFRFQQQHAYITLYGDSACLHLLSRSHHGQHAGSSCKLQLWQQRHSSSSKYSSRKRTVGMALPSLISCGFTPISMTIQYFHDGVHTVYDTYLSCQSLVKSTHQQGWRGQDRHSYTTWQSHQLCHTSSL